MCYPTFRIFHIINFFHIFMIFMITYRSSDATEVSVNVQQFNTFHKFTNAYHKTEQITAASNFRICGRELIYILIKICTPTNGTHPCFQSSTNATYADMKSNRSYRRGVATVCCSYGKCSKEYLATFCCERSVVAQ
ncbi:unnamed protein product [Cercopithifilaria johnstoni]|uniref:Uncharacterized protein n=1 Tax=Cercopithifilaria johnstoni TaxID=2874296 RepID=A0A8J2MCG5_9BILA|nr:unnamed protein product [Cercopithifilaria johnstoni]